MIPLRDRAAYEREEVERLAPYAVRAHASRGRVVAESDHRIRTAFQRDRDRVVHARAFRRLEYKTQVFVHHEGDHFRNRLTHTLEAAQIARTIARALRLNEDLAEAVTLAHDLGHPPFGHAGERVMNELMKDAGGFDHNWQTLRIVDLLEERYAAFRGLNLSYETREGILKHGVYFAHPLPLPELLAHPSLEAQLSDRADEIAYTNHDLDDGLRSSLLGVATLRELSLVGRVWAETERRMPSAPAHIVHSQAVAALINFLVGELIECSAERIAAQNPASLEEVRGSAGRLIGMSETCERDFRELKLFLYENLYYHPKVQQIADEAEHVLRDLWGIYSANHALLPVSARERMETDGEARALADYVAGMTDRFARSERERFTGAS